MKEEITEGFAAMKEEITVGFQDMKTNRDCKYYAKLPLSILILGIHIIVERINQWLVAPLPSSNHSTAMKKRQPSTGEWFTQSEEFEDWKMGTSSFIWLHGIRKSLRNQFIIRDADCFKQLDVGKQSYGQYY